MREERPKEKTSLDELFQKEKFITNLYRNVVKLTKESNELPDCEGMQFYARMPGLKGKIR